MSKEDYLFTIDDVHDVDVSSYFENCIFYKRNYIVNNNIKNILDVTLNNEIFKNEMIKNLQNNNLNSLGINYNNCIVEIHEFILFIFDKHYRANLFNILIKEFENYNIFYT